MQCLSQIYLSYLWVCDILHLWTNMKRRVLVGSLVWPEEIQLGRTPSHLLNLQIFVQSQSHLLSLKNTQVSNVLMETIASFEGIMYKGARVATTMRLLPDRLIFGLSENCLKLVDPEEMHHNVKKSSLPPSSCLIAPPSSLLHLILGAGCPPALHASTTSSPSLTTWGGINLIGGGGGGVSIFL